MTENELKLSKSKTFLQGWLDGRGYFNAIKAMKYAEKYHNGFRSGGDPEFSHQIWIANYGKTLAISEKDMEPLLTLIFLHDLCEDKKISYEEIEDKFGKQIKDFVKAISKVYFLTGEKKTEENYYQDLLEHPLIVVAKGIDRLHNLTTMYGPFSRTKQEKYIDETYRLHLPLLKEAREIFPEYRNVFESLKRDIETRIQMIKERHDEVDIVKSNFSENKSMVL